MTESPYRSGFVALVGRPNVGKSTLLNRLLGEKIAIVSPKPQTTRFQIQGILTLPQRAQVVLIDTPGVHRPLHLLGQQLLKSAQQSLRGADLVVMVVDGSKLPNEEDQQVAELLNNAKIPVMLVLNKADLCLESDSQAMQAAYEQIISPQCAIWLSARNGDGIEPALEAIIERLPEGPPFYEEDDLTNLTERVIVGEMIREQILLNTHEEIPHASAVKVDEMKWREEKQLWYIAVTIAVERDSQKGIIIGQGGRTLKLIGQNARKEIEAFLSAKAFLDIKVKMLKNWRKEVTVLKSMGYLVEEGSGKKNRAKSH